MADDVYETIGLTLILISLALAIGVSYYRVRSPQRCRNSPRTSRKVSAGDELITY